MSVPPIDREALAREVRAALGVRRSTLKAMGYGLVDGEWVYVRRRGPGRLPFMERRAEVAGALYLYARKRKRSQTR